MPKVLISDKLSDRAAAIFSERGIEVDVKTGLEPEELKKIIGEYDGLAVRSATKVTGEILEAATNMKVVGRAGIGVDNIDIPAATARGVVVMNTPFGNSITTAEHALSMMMALARQIPQANTSTHAGKWEKSKFMGTELYGKTLGLIGSGNIGSIVADRAQGLKMRVIAYDPFLSRERAIDLGVEKVELEELFRRADFITLHTPLTDQTRGIIDAGAIAKMKNGVRIVNCARGGLIVEADLKQALDSGKVAGAALDVFEVEPAKENPLFGLETLVCTPHLGASTSEAQENVALQVAEQMADYLLTGAVTNALNMPSVSAEDAPRLRPYLALAEELGGLLGQVATSSLNSVTVEYEGEIAGLNTKPITNVILMGLLRPMIDSVNSVSAPVIAKERDVDVSDTRSMRTGDYHTLIRVTVETETGKSTVAGSLFGEGKPRIVTLDEIPLEAEVSEHMLYVRNQDKPGLIGRLGSVLGESGVNIASFHLGRQSVGGDAIALVAIDQPVEDGVIAKVRDLPNVLRAQALRF
ncbi:MAG: phosphoglycerate dehydrogenase [Azospirillaceae bacterium]